VGRLRVGGGESRAVVAAGVVGAVWDVLLPCGLLLSCGVAGPDRERRWTRRGATRLGPVYRRTLGLNFGRAVILPMASLGFQTVFSTLIRPEMGLI
jgi:hypothetical protein